jgi:Flp pilus assembly protein CpaB
MSVKVDSTQASNGFILPKSRVNVVACLRDRHSGRARVITVLQDVLVLAVDTTYVRPEDRMAVPQVNAALLAVKPSESQRLTLAQSLSNGDIRLVLRAHDDETRVPLPPLTDLDHDTSAVSDSATDQAPVISYKLAVAKADVEAGTAIDDPEKYFKIESFPVAPEKAVAAEELASLKGKTLQHALFKDGILTTKHLGSELAVAKAKKSEKPKSLLFIQNGGQAPKVYVYENGVCVGEHDYAPRNPSSNDEPAKEPQEPKAPDAANPSKTQKQADS